MIISNDDGKKQLERDALHLFLEAYKYSQCEEIFPLVATEAPDFLCRRPDGATVGIELTKIIADTNGIVAADEEYVVIFNMLEKIHIAIERKKGLSSQQIILVLQLYNCAINELHSTLNNIREDFQSHQFMEIWLADYTGVEAYGDIELFCLHPAEKWGYYRRPNSERKPYG